METYRGLIAELVTLLPTSECHGAYTANPDIGPLNFQHHKHQ